MPFKYHKFPFIVIVYLSALDYAIERSIVKPFIKFMKDPESIKPSGPMLFEDSKPDRDLGPPGKRLAPPGVVFE